MDASKYQSAERYVDAPLPDEDVRSIVALVAEMALVPGPVRRKRKVLLDRLSELVLADCWVWAHSYIDQGDLRPVNLQFQECGRAGLRGRAAFALRTFGAFGVPPENASLKELAFEGQHFTRSIFELVGRDVWMNKKSRAYVYAFGMDDFVYSVVPTHQEKVRTYFSAVGLGRKVRQPVFTPRERKIIHIVTGSVGWLHHDGATTENADELEMLPVYLRCILPMLTNGSTNREIADAHMLSVDTVKKYASTLYDLLGVKNRAELIAKFAVGDGRYAP